MKNKKLSNLIKKEFFLLFLTILGVFFLVRYERGLYQEEIRKNNERILGNILATHPELEESVMESILFSVGKEELGRKTLKKYGLEEENFSFMSNTSKINTSLFLPIFLLTIILFLFLFFLNLFYILSIFKKIRFIDTYMNRVLQNDYSLLIKDNEEGALGLLQSDIYKVTVRLREETENSIQDKKNLESVLSDISHQLKTPLTSMYMINDLLSGEIDPALKKEFLNKNRNQLTRIEWLTTSLLKISRLDSGTVQLKKEKVRVQTLVDKALEPLLIPIELKNIALQVEIPKELSILCDFDWTREALINIIKNASEHTPNKGKIHIQAEENPIYTVLSIQDNGSGIDKKDAPHIFERFYKSGSKESIGIGLNMAKMIIEKQNATISFTSIPSKGTTFFIKFYKK